MDEIYLGNWSPAKNPGEPATLDEIYATSLEKQRAVANQGALWRNAEDEHDTRNAAIKSALGVELQNPFRQIVTQDDAPAIMEWTKRKGLDRAEGLLSSVKNNGNRAVAAAYFMDRYEQQLRDLHDKNPEHAAIIGAEQSPWVSVLKRAQKAEEAESDAGQRRGFVSSNIPGSSLITGPINIVRDPAGMAASMLGGLRGSLDSPADIAGNLLGFAAGGPRQSLIKNMLFNAVSNAAVQTMLEPGVQMQRKAVGLEYGVGNAMENIVGAAGVGAALDVAVRAPVRAVRKARGATDLGGVLTDAAPQLPEPPRPAPTIDPETFKAAEAGDVPALRKLAEQTRAIEDPSVKAMVEHLELTGSVDEAVKRFRDEMQSRTGTAIDDGDLQRTVAGHLRAAIDPDVLPPRREPAAVRPAAEPLMDAEAAKILTDHAPQVSQIVQGLEPRIAAMVSDGLEAGLAPIVRAVQQAIDAGPEGQPQTIANLGNAISKAADAMGGMETFADHITLHSGRSSIMEVATAMRRSPEVVDSNVSFGTEMMQVARALAMLDDAAFNIMARGEADPRIGQMVADTVEPGRQAGVLDQVARAGVRDLDEARRLIADLEPRRIPEPVRDGVDDPNSPETKAATERMEQSMAPEVEMARKAVPEPQPGQSMVDAIMQSAVVRRGAETREAIVDAIRLASKILPEGTRLEIENAEMRDPRTGGLLDAQTASNGDIILAAYAMNPAGRIGHEGVHTLVARGLLSPDEVKLLAEAAGKTEIKAEGAKEGDAPQTVFPAERRAQYAEAYADRPNLDQLLDEEAAAHLIEAVVNKKAIPEDAPKSVIERIQKMLDAIAERLKNWRDGKGWQTADDLINDILNGEVAKREGVKAWMRGEDISAMAVKRPENAPSLDAMFALSDRETGQSMRRNLDSLGYYSAALEAARSLKQAKGTPEQMLAQLRSAGVKQAEIEATNLASFLDGKKSVTRDEIVAHLEQNRVGLNEVVRTSDTEAINRAVTRANVERIESAIAAAAADPALQSVARSYQGNEFVSALTRIVNDGPPSVLGAIAGKRQTYEAARRHLDAIREARIAARPTAALAERKAAEPKWKEYSLDPSNPTYRETVLHLPDLGTKNNSIVVGPGPNGNGYVWGVVDRNTNNISAYTETVHRTAEAARAEAQNMQNWLKQQQRQTVFSSGHFPEPNIVGHMMTSMTKHEGRPVYTVDQIQSDWGQKLRDQGGPPSPERDAEIRASIDEKKRALAALPQLPEWFRSNGSIDRVHIENVLAPFKAGKLLNRSGLPQDLWDSLRIAVQRGDGDWSGSLQQMLEASRFDLVTHEGAAKIRAFIAGNQAIQQALKPLEDARSVYSRRRLLEAELRTLENNDRSTTGHPLVNTTDQWVNTTLRRALRQAAEADAAYIAIPHGDTVLSYNPGDEAGMRGFYGSRTAEGIVPKNLRKLLEKLDKDSAKPVKVEKLETPSGPRGYRPDAKGKFDKAETGFTLFPLSDKVKAEVTQRGQAMFAFAGEKARTADLDALSRAQQMEADGVDRDTIWLKEGWGKFPDGRWKFELDDSKLRIDSLTDGPLAERVAHRKLFDAYPDMGDIAFTTEVGADAALHMPRTGEKPETIGVMPSMLSAPGLLTHEAQHAIQGREGFADGGNASSYRNEPGGAAQRTELERLLSLYLEDAAAGKSVDPTKIRDAVKASREARQEHYFRLAGEVEARTAAKRRTMSPEERRARAPWHDFDVPEDQQIVRFANAEKAEPQSPFPSDLQTADRLKDAGEAIKGKPDNGAMYALADPKSVIDELERKSTIGKSEADEIRKKLDHLKAAGMSDDAALDAVAAELEGISEDKKRVALLGEKARQTLIGDLVKYRNHRGETDVLEAWKRLHERFDTTGAYIEDLETARLAIQERTLARMGGLLKEFKRGALTGDMRRKTGRTYAKQQNMVRELFGESTGDQTAKELATAVGAMFEDLRLRFNKAGGHIGKLEKWGMPQGHDAQALRDYGMQKWVDYMLQDGVLDRDRMVSQHTGRKLTDGELRDALTITWQRITTDGWVDREITGQPMGRGALFNQHADHRFLHFQSADAWLRYAKDFGNPDPYAAIMNHVARMSRDIAHMERLGPNPQMMRTYIRNWMTQKAASAGSVESLIREQQEKMAQLAKDHAEELKDLLKGRQQLLDELAERYLDMERVKMRSAIKRGLGMKEEQAKRLADLDARTRVIDNMLYNRTQQRDLLTMRHAMVREQIADMMRAMREAVEISSDKDPQAALNNTLNRVDAMWEVQRGALVPVSTKMANVLAIGRNIISADALGSAVISSITDPAYGQEARKRWGESFARSNAGTVMAQTLKQMFKPGARWEALDAGIAIDSAMSVFHSQAKQNKSWLPWMRDMSGYINDRVLSLGLLTPWTEAGKAAHGTWLQLYLGRNAHLSFEKLAPDIQKGLTANGFDAASWDQIRMSRLYDPKTHGPATRDSQAKQLRPKEIEAAAGQALAERYIAMIVRETRHGVIETTVESRAMVIGTTRPGSIPGEIVRSAGQFKGFPLAVVFIVLGRLAREIGAGDYKSAARHAASLAITSAFLGFAAMALKDIKDGRDPRRLLDEKTWMAFDTWAAAILQAGGLGIWGDFLFSNVNRQGNGLAATLGGPMVDRIDNIKNLTIGNLFQIYQGKDTQVGREGVRFLRQNVPGVSSWFFTSMAWNRIFMDEMQRMVDPKAHEQFRAQIMNRRRDYGGQEYWWKPGQTRPERAPDLTRPFATQ